MLYQELVLLVIMSYGTRKLTSSSVPQTVFVPATNNDPCECYILAMDHDIDYECRCLSKYLTFIPQNLGGNLTKLTVNDANIRFLHRDCLNPYRSTLKDITLGNLQFLSVIEDGTFRNIPNLRTIYISLASELKTLHGLLEGVTSIKFYSLRIVQTGLEEIPDLSYLPPENVMHLLDLDSNNIGHLLPNSVKLTAEQVTLNYNNIQSVDNFAFNGSQIAKINLRGNRKLTKLETAAFSGLKSLRELDLSQTAIVSLPIAGLGDLEILRIEDTPSMKTIPSIYDLENLKIARLTHPFHCCAFKYPEHHNPERHARHEQRMKLYCQQAKLLLDTGQLNKKISRRSKRFLQEFSDLEKLSAERSGANLIGYENLPRSVNSPVQWRSDTSFYNSFRGKIIDREEGEPMEINEDFGVFHGESAEISDHTSVNAFCGNISIPKPNVKCSPEPNALNPCEDIMGSSWLRISVWFVVILTVMGNVAVITVVLFSGSDLTVTRFLICNLAIADLCMGVYLFLIASMDLHSVGTYFNFAFDWQYGMGCQIAGFLTVFASHLSIFTLTIVTIERWFAITYAIYLTRRIRIGTAAKTMLFGWIYSIFIAALPLFGVSNYSSTSICLPMEVNRVIDKAYLYSMILVNGVAFALIVFCYAKIYFSLGYETRRASTRGELTIAKKMALLIFTDFATWAPITFFAITALAGYPLIGVTRSKILLVFFYPLNSCANPYLYAILTAQYRQDFLVLLTRCGCNVISKKKRPYTLSTSADPTQSNNIIQLPLQDTTQKKNKINHHNDVYV